MTGWLEQTAVIALAAFYFTRLLRKLSRWLAARRPVGCNECMSWWAALAACGAALLSWRLVSVAAAAGACLLLLDWAETLRPPPIDLGPAP